MENNKSNNIIIALLMVIIILGILVLLFATDTIRLNSSANHNETNGTNSNVENENTTNDNEDKDTEKLNNDQMYSTIVTEYKNAINDTSIPENYDKIAQEYPNVNEKIMSYYHTYHTQKFVYAYFDIDNNGVDEMIVADQGTDSYSIIGIFTYNGTSPVKLIDDFCLGDRCDVQVWNNGVLYYRGSGGASSGTIEFSKIGTDGYSNQVINSYYYQYDDNNQVSFFSDVNETNKLNYASVYDIEEVHLSNASVVSMNTLEWNSIN